MNVTIKAVKPIGLVQEVLPAREAPSPPPEPQWKTNLRDLGILVFVLTVFIGGVAFLIFGLDYLFPPDYSPTINLPASPPDNGLTVPDANPQCGQ